MIEVVDLAKLGDLVGREMAVSDWIEVTQAEREHGDKPCCVAEWLVRYYPL